MRTSSGRRGRWFAWAKGVAGFALLMLTVRVGWSSPRTGSAAPALAPMTLLQAPAGARADWASLRGKVVVLEFWATWCSPCVASLPHLNELVERLDRAKFQFLSIDDEDVAAVRMFLSKKKMLGWVGVDPSGKVLAAYGVNSRPMTVIADGRGKVVAVTDIESVTAADLEAVAEGRPVRFREAAEVVKASAAASPDVEHALFAVAVKKAAADAKPSTVEHGATGTDFLGQDADSLLTDVLYAFAGRYVLKDSLPAGRFDLRVNYGDLPAGVAALIVQQAVLGALDLRMEEKTLTWRAYVLRATAQSKGLLSPSASTHAAKRGYWHGRFLLMNGSMDDLAYILGTGLQTPVVNETGIAGRYDARFQVTGSDVDSLNEVLRKTLGLELVPGEQELPITVFELSRAGGRRERAVRVRARG